MKVSAEYTYKNGAGEKPCTVSLTDYNLIIQTGDQIRSIPYANIVSVRLCRSRNRFTAIVQPDGQPSITISNQFYLSGREYEDRSRQYATFVRILHFHLKDKSTPEYVCGKHLHRLITWACILVVLSFAVAFVLDYFNQNPFSTWGLALLISGVMLLILTATSWGRFPNIYKPDQIPFQFLPQ
ncbi:MAG: hypothetical protein E6Q96_08995 [Cyclobacteriaceae bacterium]|nr:MAG: hypothetical protein E6Q96_08995 [Cyclobacteriaceae bacterium]